MSELLEKVVGMDLSASRNARFLALARSLAVYHAKMHDGYCSIEDVRRWANFKRISIDFTGNWVGSVFKGKNWEYAGMVQSVHKGGHARRVIQWKLIADVPIPVMPEQKKEQFELAI